MLFPAVCDISHVSYSLSFRPVCVAVATMDLIFLYLTFREGYVENIMCFNLYVIVFCFVFILTYLAGRSPSSITVHFHVSLTCR